MFSKRALSLLSALSLVTLPAMAEDVLVGYWNLNGNYDPNPGSTAVLDGMLAEIGVGQITWGTGTLENALPDTPAGQSLQFYEFGALYVTGYIEMRNLDFSGLTTPTVSFAYRKEATVSLFEHFWLEYSTTTLHPHWIKVTDIPEPTQIYDVYSYTFAAGLLDGLEHAAIRIHFREAVDFDTSIDFDNLKITAVPEPGSIVLAGAGLLIAGGVYRRRRALRRC